jgi:hypothetical protein
MINRKVLSMLVALTRGSRVCRFSKQSELEKITKGGKELDGIIPEIKKPRDPDGGVHSVERVIEKEAVSEELRDRMERLRQRHELLRVELAQKAELPFSLCGINRKTYHESYGYMPERVMSYYRIHPTTITDYLLKLYKATLYAITDRNSAFMDEYLEAGLKQKALEAVQAAQEKGFRVRVAEDKKFGEEMQESCRIVDAIMIRGLSIVR